jgi:cytochrome c
MKKFILAVFILLAASFAVSFSILTAANAKTMPKKMMISKNAKLIARGKKLFYSKDIGTNGFSCATCHVYSAGTYINMHGRGMVIRPIKNAAKKMAEFDKMHHMHMTVKTKVKMCAKFALRGHISKGDLKALTAYVGSLK